ncbi:hypothetical protein PoB_007576900 [Plakobranchus ocellatus]|uniref:PNPLA domain-containing protein n=1 Tax=Plakobranchus ocellatus TaxID=259542 RepID=A0AAV4DYX4_9GAST|nr:hypothetical protein PoB_007576900 [Plakobranchus ocellatus]
MIFIIFCLSSSSNSLNVDKGYHICRLVVSTKPAVRVISSRVPYSLWGRGGEEVGREVSFVQAEFFQEPKGSSKTAASALLLEAQIHIGSKESHPVSFENLRESGLVMSAQLVDGFLFADGGIIPILSSSLSVASISFVVIAFL